MDFQTLRVRRAPPTLRAQINRPQAQNSLNAELMQELIALQEAGEWETDIRILVLEGMPEVL